MMCTKLSFMIMGITLLTLLTKPEHISFLELIRKGMAATGD